MKRFAIVGGIAVVVAILLGLEVSWLGAGDTDVLGLRAVSFGGKGSGPAWLAFGDEGVLVLGAGFGLVEIGVAGVGILFATGQVSAGLFAIGQLSFGLLGVIAQLGFGTTGIGQLVIGGLVEGQGRLGFSGGEFLRGFDEDVNRFLRWR